MVREKQTIFTFAVGTVMEWSVSCVSHMPVSFPIHYAVVTIYILH